MQPPTTYKYFCYRVGTTWRGQQLLSIAQIRSQLVTLRWEYEVFATMQSYDEYGNCLGSPLYFDFDGKPDEVLHDARAFVTACEFVINVTPRIYFSGNRGFHFVIDHFIEHPKCHLLALDFAKELAPRRTIDLRVYRNQAMFRIPGSLSSNRIHFKIQLSRSELLSLDLPAIRTLGSVQRMIADDHDVSKIDSFVMADWFQTALAKLPNYTDATKLREAFDEQDTDFTACLEALLYNDPQPGTRNESIFVLARHFKIAGFDRDTTLETILGQPHWAEWDSLQGEATKIVRSLYNSSRSSHIGCRGETSSAQLMRDNCDKRCFFRTDWPELNLIDDRPPP